MDSANPPEKHDSEGAAAEDARYAAKGGLVQILYVCAQALLQVHFIAVSRLFGMATYGLYASCVSALEVLIRLGCFGADKGMYKFVAAHHSAREVEQEANALRSGMKLSLIFSSGIAVLMFFGAEAISSTLARWSPNPDTAEKLGQVLPAFAFAVPAGATTIVLVAAGLSQRIARISLLARGIAEPGLLLGFGLIAWALHADARGLGLAHSLALAGTAVIAFVILAYANGWPWIARAWRAGRHPGFARFVMPLAALEFVNTLRMQIDLLVVLPMLGRDSAALYSASAFLGRIGAQVRYAFDGIASPLFSSAIGAHDSVRLRMNVHYLTRLVATLSIPLVTTMVALRDEWLNLYGKQYLAASTIALIHIAGHFLNGVLGLMGQVVSMSGYSSAILVIQVVALVTNTVTCILLIPGYGMMGAALGFAAGFAVVFIGNLVIAYVLQRVSPFHRALLKPFLAGAVTLVLQVWLSSQFANAAVTASVTIVVGLSVYAVALYSLGLEKAESDMLEKWRQRRRAS